MDTVNDAATGCHGHLERRQTPGGPCAVAASFPAGHRCSAASTSFRYCGDQPLQPRDALRLLRDLRLQLRVFCPQPRVRLLERGNRIRRIRCVRHTVTTLQHRYTAPLSDQIDTISQACAVFNPRPDNGS
jgi:hypothetical protein